GNAGDGGRPGALGWGRGTLGRGCVAYELNRGQLLEGVQLPVGIGRVGYAPVSGARVPTTAGNLAEPTHDLGIERHHDDAERARPRPADSDDDHGSLHVSRSARWIEARPGQGNGEVGRYAFSGLRSPRK